MIRITGLIFFGIGIALLYCGWRSYDEVSFALSLGEPDASVAKAPWLIALGLGTGVWGLTTLSRRM